MKNESRIKEIDYGNMKNGYYPLKLKTDRGIIHCRFYNVPESNLGAVWVGGVGGDFDTPANDLYPNLSKELMNFNISSLRIQFRNPKNLKECIYDVLTGIGFLNSEKISKIALIGHSLGGAVVIRSAVMSDYVKTVITLATQSYGADEVKNLSNDTSILLIHGSDDSVLSASCSRAIYGIANEPKERIILKGNGHCLDESSDEVKKIVFNWILSKLKDIKT